MAPMASVTSNMSKGQHLELATCAKNSCTCCSRVRRLPYTVKGAMAFILRRIREVGGFRNASKILWRARDVRAGTLVGEDKFGNKYYENLEYFFGRDRFVFYARKDFDGSQVPAEWHCWLHHMTDKVPGSEPDKKFLLDHRENKTGTTQEYVPYSTTNPKIESWKP